MNIKISFAKIYSGLVLLILLTSVNCSSNAKANVVPVAPNYLQTSGNQIIDSSNRAVGLSGVNWFGFETPSAAPHGLQARSWQDILDQVKRLGYNTIRLPFSNAMLQKNVKPTDINYQLNPDLKNLNSLQVMDKIIGGAEARRLRVVLDNHRSTPGDGPEDNGLWYTGAYSESAWIADWKMLVERYRNTPAVIGVDLRNEPFGGCWGCNDPAKDWRLAAEKAGNAILDVNPNLLIIVEGVFTYNDQHTWRGGNLMGAQDNPVRLKISNRLVYSAHEYPQSVYSQPWFDDPSYPANLPSVWDKHWGFLVKNNIAPVLIGEFGTRYQTDKDKQWFKAFQGYIQKNKLSWIFWSLNPDSTDTGGLLMDDWTAVDQTKQDFLKQIQYPLLDFDPRLSPSPTP